jgi:transposase
MNNTNQPKSKKRMQLSERLAIWTSYKAGCSVKTIAENVRVSERSVYRVIRSMQLTGSLFQRKTKKLGRPSKTTKEMDNFIVGEVENNRKLLPKQIQQQLQTKFGISLGLTQIRSRLVNAGLHGRVCARKPLLRPVNKFKRLVWAIKHRTWTPEDWKRVLWSDEKKFELFNSKRRTYCRKKTGEQFRNDTVQATVKHGGGSVMYWGCFGNNTPGELSKIEGIMKKEKYKSILEQHAFPSGKEIFAGQKWYFQQDNDPKHSSILCRNYTTQEAVQNNFAVMTWPPQSPDLSPIELLWDEVDRQVQAKRPSNKAELDRTVLQVWSNLQQDTLNKLIDRMPRLCVAVINAEGGYFDEKLQAVGKLQVYK